MYTTHICIYVHSAASGSEPVSSVFDQHSSVSALLSLGHYDEVPDAPPGQAALLSRTRPPALAALLSRTTDSLAILSRCTQGILREVQDLSASSAAKAGHSTIKQSGAKHPDTIAHADEALRRRPRSGRKASTCALRRADCYHNDLQSHRSVGQSRRCCSQATNPL